MDWLNPGARQIETPAARTPRRFHPYWSAPGADAPGSALKDPLKLSQFLTDNAEAILLEWDAFAATVVHEGKDLDQKALRDHAGEILKAIAQDLAEPQSSAERDAKSKGLGVRSAASTPAEAHADYRIMSGFAIDAMITEYRALRASVLKFWARSGEVGADQIADITRFNEAIDQAIAESVGRYTSQTKKSTDLFIGILGHDIRNPLGTIVMSAEILARSGQAPQKVVTTIINSAVRINGLIEQVLDFTRAQVQGAIQVQRLPGDLAGHLLKVLSETQAHHPDRQIEMRKTGSFAGSWDEGRIGQLLSNLLGNAIRYGDPARPVVLAMWSDEMTASFSVHNGGAAIAPHDLARIFEPMARGTGVDERMRTREPSGLGLGLYICREIVRSHGGTLAVESTDEAGTTFTVTLPRREAV